MRIVFKGEHNQWIKATSEYERIIAHAATAAVREAGKAAREAARSAIASAGFGLRWQRSMKYVMKPRTGDVLNPVAWVHSTINFSDVFEYGKTISGAPWLWLPLPVVPKWPGDSTRQMSAKKYIETFGKGSLKFAKRPGRTPILLGIARGGSSRKPMRKIKGGMLGTRGKLQWVPMFVGIATVNIEARFNTVDAMERAAEELPKFYAANLEKYEGR